MAVIHEDLAESLYVPGAIRSVPPGGVARHSAVGQDHVLPHRLLGRGPRAGGLEGWRARGNHP